MIALHDLGLVHPASGAALMTHGDLAVAGGQVVVVAAPPGAGSSLLAATVLGERKPSAGVVHLFERDPHRLRTGALRRLRGRIGVAPQVAPMVVGRTVLGQVALALELAGVGRAARILDARSAPMRRPRPPVPRPEVPTAIPAVTSDGIPNVVAFPITARSLGAT